MMIEAAVGSGVHAATHKIEHEIEHAQSTISGLERKISELESTLSGTPVEPEQAAAAARPSTAPWASRLPTLLAWLLIGLTALKLFRELLHL
jgi:hypothetical protein